MVGEAVGDIVGEGIGKDVGFIVGVYEGATVPSCKLQLYIYLEQVPLHNSFSCCL